MRNAKQIQKSFFIIHSKNVEIITFVQIVSSNELNQEKNRFQYIIHITTRIRSSSNSSHSKFAEWEKWDPNPLLKFAKFWRKTKPKWTKEFYRFSLVRPSLSHKLKRKQNAKIILICHNCISKRFSQRDKSKYLLQMPILPGVQWTFFVRFPFIFAILWPRKKWTN